MQMPRGCIRRQLLLPAPPNFDALSLLPSPSHHGHPPISCTCGAMHWDERLGVVSVGGWVALCKCGWHCRAHEAAVHARASNRMRRSADHRRHPTTASPRHASTLRPSNSAAFNINRGQQRTSTSSRRLAKRQAWKIRMISSLFSAITCKWVRTSMAKTGRMLATGAANRRTVRGNEGCCS